MVMCWVPHCHHYSEQQRCRYFRFPREPSLRTKWIALIRRADRLPSKNSLVCSCHFRNGDKNNLPTEIIFVGPFQDEYTEPHLDSSQSLDKSSQPNIIYIMQNFAPQEDKSRFQKKPEPKYVHSSATIKRNSYKNVNKCETCPYFSKSIFSIINHVRRHHLPFQLFDCQRNDLELYYCTKCDFTFNSTIHLRKHIKEAHQIRGNKVGSECTLRSYICRACSFETHSTLHWLKHRGCSNSDV